MTATESQILQLYGYMPNLGANSAGLALTSLLVIAQIGLGLYYQQWWMMATWVIGLAMTITGYAIRVTVRHVDYGTLTYKIQYAFFILAPSFIMAGVYFQMTKLLTIHGRQFAKHKPIFYTRAFIGCDLVSIFIQGGGGGAAVNSSTANIGRWIIVVGIVFQLVSMLAFFLCFIRLAVRIRQAREAQLDPRYAEIRARPMFGFLVPAVCVCWLFVFIRSIYRVVEMIQGYGGYLAKHEIYFLVLEGLMMILAMSSLTIVYPGVCYGGDAGAASGRHKKHFESDEKYLVEESIHEY